MRNKVKEYENKEKRFKFKEEDYLRRIMTG
jgi:hypothetical protein